MKDESRRAVAGLLIAVAAVAAALAPVVGSHHPVFLAAVVVVAFVTAGLAVTLEIPDVRALMASRPHGRRSLRGKRLPVSPPPPVVPGTWLYTSDGSLANSAMRAGELVMPGTGYRLEPDDRGPWIRFVVLIACGQVGVGVEPAQLWTTFQKFLKNQPVSSLVNSLTRPGPGAWWTRWASRSAGTIDAVFTPDNDEKGAVASARLALPDGTTGSAIDSRYALLMLHFEPPAQAANGITPVGPVAWIDHMRRALGKVSHLA